MNSPAREHLSPGSAPPGIDRFEVDDLTREGWLAQRSCRSENLSVESRILWVRRRAARLGVTVRIVSAVRHPQPVVPATSRISESC